MSKKYALPHALFHTCASKKQGGKRRWFLPFVMMVGLGVWQVVVWLWECISRCWLSWLQRQSTEEWNPRGAFIWVSGLTSSRTMVECLGSCPSKFSVGKSEQAKHVDSWRLFFHRAMVHSHFGDMNLMESIHSFSRYLWSIHYLWGTLLDTTFLEFTGQVDK